MPNWTTNHLTIEGRPADLRALLEAIRSQDELFDFDRITPMPALLRHTGSGARHFEGTRHDTWYVENPDAEEEDRIERPFTDDEKAVLRDIGHSGWYSWRCANWGTKWAPSNVNIDDAAIEQGRLIIDFMTAWNPPGPILEKLFDLFPALAFRCEWRNEDDRDRAPYPHCVAKATVATS